jgi:hypothetical protein
LRIAVLIFLWRHHRFVVLVAVMVTVVAAMEVVVTVAAVMAEVFRRL